MLDVEHQAHILERWSINKKDDISDSQNITAYSISDFDSICDIYQDAIIEVYNQGIISGVSDDMIFAPKMILTRAQVCQLFYNLDK